MKKHCFGIDFDATMEGFEIQKQAFHIILVAKYEVLVFREKVLVIRSKRSSKMTLKSSFGGFTMVKRTSVLAGGHTCRLYPDKTYKWSGRRGRPDHKVDRLLTRTRSSIRRHGTILSNMRSPERVGGYVIYIYNIT